MKFKSKVDWWFNGIMAFICVIAVYLLITAGITKSLEQLYSGLICCAIAILIIFPVYFFTYYEINEDTLIIKSGYFYKNRIQIAHIKAISPTHNPLSSAALSIHRIAIYYNNGKKITNEFISPKDKDEFISALLKINPDINIKNI